MECVSHKAEIKNTFSSVREFSFNEKRNPVLDEEKMNMFLDAISDFKSAIKEKTLNIYDLNKKLERITWFDDIDEECLKLINDIISLGKDLHSSLIRQYLSFNDLRQRGIAKNEIRDFKNSIDELKESYYDLESVFFFLPEIPEFKETTKLLSLV